MSEKESNFSRRLKKIMTGEITDPYMFYSEEVGKLCRPVDNKYNKEPKEIELILAEIICDKKPAKRRTDAYISESTMIKMLGEMI